MLPDLNGENSAFYHAMMQRIDWIVDYLEGSFGQDFLAPARRFFLCRIRWSRSFP